jgi:plastocyanin
LSFRSEAEESVFSFDFALAAEGVLTVKSRTHLILLATLCTLGCRRAAPPVAPIVYTQIDPATAGAISGTVHFSGPAPERIRIDMAEDPICAHAPENLTEQYLVHNGRLANVYIYVSDGLGNRVYPAPAAPVIMDQKGCRFTPHVIGVMAGQPVEYRNSDATLHNVHTLPMEMGNESTDVTQAPMGAPERRVYTRPERMISVRCNNHPWMNAWVNVSASPFYAVSDADGHFEIKGLPPGTYTLTAIHEKGAERTTTITVASQKTTTANFNFAAE